MTDKIKIFHVKENRIAFPSGVFYPVRRGDVGYINSKFFKIEKVGPLCAGDGENYCEVELGERVARTDDEEFYY